MRKLISIISILFFALAATAQESKISWSSHIEPAGENEYNVVFTGKIAPGYHTYTLTDEFSATEFLNAEITGGELVGGPYELGTPVTEIDEFGDTAQHYYDEIVLGQKVRLSAQSAQYTGTIYHPGKS